MQEVFVDREGKLYKDRPYGGQVPDWNVEIPSNATGRCKVEPQMLTWVGFQNTADASRVYVQLEHDACGYVYRPDDTHVVIDLPQVAILNANLRREILRARVDSVAKAAAAVTATAHSSGNAAQPARSAACTSAAVLRTPKSACARSLSRLSADLRTPSRLSAFLTSSGRLDTWRMGGGGRGTGSAFQRQIGTQRPECGICRRLLAGLRQ